MELGEYHRVPGSWSLELDWMCHHMQGKNQKKTIGKFVFAAVVNCSWRDDVPESSNRVVRNEMLSIVSCKLLSLFLSLGFNEVWNLVSN